MMDDGNTVLSPEARERFLGIYSGRINPESDLGIVWKASAVAEIVDAAVNVYQATSDPTAPPPAEPGADSPGPAGL